MNNVKINVDKENVDVMYNDEYHKYWTKEGEQSCVSVTTLIHRFENFDENFWSAYKTMEKLMGSDFNLLKGTLLATKRFDEKYIADFGFTKETFDRERGVILNEWKEKRDISCIRGTAIHKQFELGHIAGDTKELSMLKLGGTFSSDRSNLIKPGERAVYSELLLSRISEDKKLRLAGQADLVIIDGFDVYILDYKTSKKIDTKAYFDTKSRKKVMMKYPLNNIEDSNFWHYSLQLSTYAWMIQKLDPRLNIKLLMLIHIDHDNNVNNYECNYLKDEVERMLKFYKKEILNKEFYDSMKKISWE